MKFFPKQFWPHLCYSSQIDFNTSCMQMEPDKRSWRLNVLRSVGDVIWRCRDTIARGTFEFRASARVPVVIFKHDASSAQSLCQPWLAQAHLHHIRPHPLPTVMVDRVTQPGHDCIGCFQFFEAHLVFFPSWCLHRAHFACTCWVSLANWNCGTTWGRNLLVGVLHLLSNPSCRR